MRDGRRPDGTARRRDRQRWSSLWCTATGPPRANGRPSGLDGADDPVDPRSGQEVLEAVAQSALGPPAAVWRRVRVDELAVEVDEVRLHDAGGVEDGGVEALDRTVPPPIVVHEFPGPRDSR